MCSNKERSYFALLIENIIYLPYDLSYLIECYIYPHLMAVLPLTIYFDNNCLYNKLVFFGDAIYIGKYKDPQQHPPNEIFILLLDYI